MTQMDEMNTAIITLTTNINKEINAITQALAVPNPDLTSAIDRLNSLSTVVQNETNKLIPPTGEAPVPPEPAS